MRREVTDKKRISGYAKGGRLARAPAKFDEDGESGTGKAGGQAFDPAKRRREAQDRKKGQDGPLAGSDGHGYEREGDSGGVDESQVDRLLTERVAAKRSREYDTADKIRDDLRAMGVEVADKERTWRVRGSGGGGGRGGRGDEGRGRGGHGDEFGRDGSRGGGREEHSRARGDGEDRGRKR